MIKDIVVNLNIGLKANSASDYAISVAAALEAHLTGMFSFTVRSCRFRAPATFRQNWK